jgi:hypothetical protein
MSNKGWTTSEDINPDAIDKNAPPPLQDDLYVFTIMKAEPEASSNGNAAYKLELKAEEVFGGGALPEKCSRTIRDTIVFTVASAWKTKQVCEAAGVKMATKTSVEAVDQMCLDLLQAGTVIAKTKLSRSKTDATKSYANIDTYFTKEEAAKARAGATGNAPAANAPRRGRTGAPAAPATK